jgi:hypothetical protein
MKRRMTGIEFETGGGIRRWGGHLGAVLTGMIGASLFVSVASASEGALASVDAAGSGSSGQGETAAYDLAEPSGKQIEASALFAGPSSGTKTSQQLFSSKDFQLGVDVTGVYDDNIFISASDEESDFIFRITPIIGFSSGDSVLKEESYLSLLYTPTAEIFTDHSDQNAFNQDLSLGLAYRIKKLKISYAGRYETLSDATPDVGDRFDRRIYSNFLELAYDLSPKTRIIARGDLSNVKYKDNVALERSDESTVEGLLQYDLTDKTKIALGYAYGVLDVRPSSSDQKFQRGIGEVEWSFSDKITLFAAGGVEYRDFGSVTGTTGIYDLGIDYRLREGTEFSLRSYRRVEPSAFLVDQDFLSTGVRGTVRQRLGDRFTLAVEGGYESARYRDISGRSDGPNRKDKVFYVRPSVAYSLRDWLSFELFYLYQKDDSNFAEFKYNNNQIGAQISLKF